MALLTSFWSSPVRSAPFRCPTALSCSIACQLIAALRRSMAAPRQSQPFHRFAIPGLASPFRCFAIPGSSIPCHRSTVQCRRFANLRFSVTKQFVAFPSLRNSWLFLRFSCHFFAQRTAAYPFHSQPSKSLSLSILAFPFPGAALLCFSFSTQITTELHRATQSYSFS